MNEPKYCCECPKLAWYHINSKGYCYDHRELAKQAAIADNATRSHARWNDFRGKVK